MSQRRLDVAILCPGPSLAAWSERLALFEAYDLRIAVNRAAMLGVADWWVALDYCAPEMALGPARAAWSRPGGRGEPRLLMLGDQYCTLQGKAGDPEATADRRDAVAWTKTLHDTSRLTITESFTWGPHEPDPGYEVSWRTFSTNAAMVLAERLGAGAIDVYGHDMSGQVDFAGVAGAEPHSRDGDRWSRETVLWRNVRKWARTRAGITVRRLGADGQELDPPDVANG